MVDGQEWPKGETPAVSTWPRNKAGRLRPIVPITGQKIDMQLNTSLACRRDCHLTDRSNFSLAASVQASGRMQDRLRAVPDPRCGEGLDCDVIKGGHRHGKKVSARFRIILGSLTLESTVSRLGKCPGPVGWFLHQSAADAHYWRLFLAQAEPEGRAGGCHCNVSCLKGNFWRLYVPLPSHGIRRSWAQIMRDVVVIALNYSNCASEAKIVLCLILKDSVIGGMSRTPQPSLVSCSYGLIQNR